MMHSILERLGRNVSHHSCMEEYKAPTTDNAKKEQHTNEKIWTTQTPRITGAIVSTPQNDVTDMEKLKSKNCPVCSTSSLCHQTDSSEPKIRRQKRKQPAPQQFTDENKLSEEPVNKSRVTEKVRRIYEALLGAYSYPVCCA